jgi:NAD(P)-dependent dehydrogenase (short-subunit alcohol dehydrogenase family)
MNNPVTVTTGTNSGIGRATALHLAGQRHRVFATMRSLDKGTKLVDLADASGVEVTAVVVDVSNGAEVKYGFDAILAAAGGSATPS